MLPWIILCCAALLICLLLSVKLGLRVVLRGGAQVWVKIGFFKRQLYPFPEPREKNPKKQKKDAAAPEKKEKRQITWGAVQRLAEALLPTLLHACGRFRRGLRVQELTGRIVVSDPNPADAARRYGTLNAVVWPALTLLENAVTVERRDVQIYLDFSAGATAVSGEALVTLRLYHLAAIGLTDGLKMIGPVSRFLKEIKPDKGAKPSDPKNNTNSAAA